jgi:hypothetical protein
LLAAYGTGTVLKIFWNDGTTHRVAIVALVAVAICYFAEKFRTRAAIGIGFAVAVAAAASLAGSHPEGYFVDATANGGERTEVFSWIAAHGVDRIGVLGLRAGVLNVLDPDANVIDLSNETPCRDASASQSVALDFSDHHHDAVDAARLHMIEACGTTQYADKLATIVIPN